MSDNVRALCEVDHVGKRYAYGFSLAPLREVGNLREDYAVAQTTYALLCDAWRRLL